MKLNIALRKFWIGNTMMYVVKEVLHKSEREEGAETFYHSQWDHEYVLAISEIIYTAE